MQRLGFLTVAVMAGAALSTPGFAAEQAGVSGGVQGQIQLASVGVAIGRQVKSGEQIFIGDRIRSGGDAGMQVMLLDESVFTVGADSDITIDEFVYDPNTNVGKVTASIGKGAFRFITGKIAAARPEAMEVRTPTSTIGVRGTIVYGLNTDTESIAILGGPGPQKNSSDRQGGINVRGSGGDAVEVRRSGYAAITRGNQTIVQFADAALLQRVYTQLFAARTRAAGNSQQLNGGAASDQAGQGIAQAVEAAIATITANQSSDSFNDDREDAAQSSSSNEPVVPGGNTKISQLLAINSGIASYSQAGNVLTGASGGSSGSYIYTATINFASRLISGSFNNINTTGGFNNVSNGSMSFSQNYASLNPNNSAFVSGSGTCGTFSCSGSTSFFNLNGRTAQHASYSLTINGVSTDTSSGGGVANRQ